MKFKKLLLLLSACFVIAGTTTSCGETSNPSPEIDIDEDEDEDKDRVVNLVKSINKSIDFSKEFKNETVNLKESLPFINKKKSFYTIDDESKYLYYELITYIGFSGCVVLEALVNDQNEVIKTEFVGGDEDGSGIIAAKNLLITPDEPYKSGTPVQSGSSASRSLPAIGEALDAILADARTLPNEDSVYPEKPDFENITKASEKLGKKLIKSSIKNSEIKVYESKPYINKKKEIKFENDNETYYYYDLNSASGHKGQVKFGIIVDSEPKVISYIHIGGNEDQRGIKASELITISYENPYKPGNMIQSGTTAIKTMSGIRLALDAAIADASFTLGVEPDSDEEFKNIIITSGQIGKKPIIFSIKDVSVNKEESNIYILAKKFVKFKDDNSNYLYYELNTNKGFSGKIKFGIIVDCEPKAISYAFLGGDEDQLGIYAAKQIRINLNNPYKLNDSNIESGATAVYTLPAIKEAIDAALEDAKSN